MRATQEGAALPLTRSEQGGAVRQRSWGTKLRRAGGCARHPASAIRGLVPGIRIPVRLAACRLPDRWPSCVPSPARRHGPRPNGGWPRSPPGRQGCQPVDRTGPTSIRHQNRRHFLTDPLPRRRFARRGAALRLQARLVTRAREAGYRPRRLHRLRPACRRRALQRRTHSAARLGLDARTPAIEGPSGFGTAGQQVGMDQTKPQETPWSRTRLSESASGPR